MKTRKRAHKKTKLFSCDKLWPVILKNATFAAIYESISDLGFRISVPPYGLPSEAAINFRANANPIVRKS